MNLQCIIADDEPIARNILENYINEIPDLTIVAVCKNAFEVLDVLQKQAVDILFLDINMPKLSGLSLLKSLQQKPAVIITTAYPDYAIEGFELSVTDYLLKPFSLERFLQAVLKVKQLSKRQIETVSPSKNNEPETVFVKSDKKIIKLIFEDIHYIEAYGNYIKIHSDAMILTPQTLSDFLEKCPNSFVRIHKSFCVNFNQMKLIDGNQLVLNNGVKLPIGKSFKKEIISKIDEMSS